MIETLEIRGVRRDLEGMPQWVRDRCVCPAGDRWGQIRGRLDDPDFQEVLGILRELCERLETHNVFTWWGIERRYSEREMAEAELFQFTVTRTFEPCGEEVGTVYDYSGICPQCRQTGRALRGRLKLDLSRVPRSADFSGTLALDENVVSDRMQTVLRAERLTGCECSPVEQCRRGRSDLPRCHQFRVSARVGRMVPPTRFGEDPINLPSRSEYACSACHLHGLSLLTEVSVSRSAYQGEDFVETEDWIGPSRGLLVPAHVTLVSPRAARVLRVNGARGFKLEVAHLV